MITDEMLMKISVMSTLKLKLKLTNVINDTLSVKPTR